MPWQSKILQVMVVVRASAGKGRGRLHVERGRIEVKVAFLPRECVEVLADLTTADS